MLISARKGEWVLHNGKILTLEKGREPVQALAIRDGLIEAAGDTREVLAFAGAEAERIDLRGKTVIPGLNDSHIHLIRGGLSFNIELRWDGVTSLADGMSMLKEQVKRTPPPQWVRVVGGWTGNQFRERRLPTLDELNEAAPETPVFLLHLYDRALMNRAALRAAGFSRETPDSPGAIIDRDRSGNPTGLIIANPNASLLYSTLAKGPKLDYGDQLNSTRQFMRELNRLGVTSVIDAGGGSHYYPEDYQVIEELHREELLTVRIAYNLFTQKPGGELNQFKEWTKAVSYGGGDRFYRANGAGEMLVFSATDFEDFYAPRPDLPAHMEQDLEGVVRHLASSGWPFRLHATYDESIRRALKVYERVDRDIPLNGLHWFIDHAETISDESIDRIARMGGGIAIQHRMAFQGEQFTARYGTEQTERTPPIRRILEAGVPLGAGTDATRVASYNPFVALYWLICGRTVGGMELYPETNRLSRLKALELYTAGSSWFSNEQGCKGTLAPGQYADLAVLSGDFLGMDEEEIPGLESLLTMVGGKVVYATGEFRAYGPPGLPVSPDWSPMRRFGTYQAPGRKVGATITSCCTHRSAFHGLLNCDCFAF